MELRPQMSLCFLIIENSTVVAKVGDDVRLSAFVIKMEDIFERYIRTVLDDAFKPELRIIDGNKNKRALFKNAVNPQIPPDMMVYDSSKCLIVADTKYKEKNSPVVDDWYQLISYSMALEVPSGVLIYSANKPSTPRSFQIGDKTVWVYYFSLDQPKHQEEMFVEFFRQRISESISATTLASTK
jgi:5-methylcytosine-specific restriction endonuclease McrBC regulatory subunit McrC